VIVVLVVFGVALSWVSEYLPRPADRLHVQFLFMLLFAVSGLGWMLDGWRTQVGRWFTIVALAMLVHLSNVWLDSPSLLTLLTIPIPLASALISLPAATGAAVAETLLLLLLQRPLGVSTDRTLLFGILAALWAWVGLKYAVYGPVHQIARWSWTHYQQARAWMKEAGDRQVSLKHA
jgi:hypothetical protein